MGRKILALLLVFSLTACSALVPSATPTAPIVPTSTPRPLRGEWLGSVFKPGAERESLWINFDTGTLRIEPRTDTWAVKSSWQGDVSSFSAVGEPGDPFAQIDFSGTFIGGYLSGELTWDGQNSLVTFLPIASIDSSGLERFEGVYRLEPDRVFSIVVSPSFSANGLQFFGPSLMMTDFKSGALRALYPVNDSTFLIGSLRVVGAPFSGRIQFETNDQGDVQGLRWWQTPHDLFTSPVPGFYAPRISFTTADIPFTSADGTSLMGRLSLPESTSPVAAFMMLHGSERGTRDNFSNKLMAHYLISHGFAILNYDKRGVGDSEGIYQESASAANLQLHAEDAIAGVEYLAARPEIDAKRIGLIGFSQAGWIIPLAASQSETISHFVSLSGPVASTAHESMFSSYTNDGESLENFDDTEITEQLHKLNPGGFDPLPIIAELDQPGLWLWGSVDKSVPVTFSAENLQALIDSGKLNFAYQVLPNGDHGLNASSQGLFTEIPYSPGVLYYAALDEWLQGNMSSVKK
jgi:alpha/beta superfamily hydrolase